MRSCHFFCSAQAFQDLFSDFVAWLRETERKIQRDDPLRLEVAELKEGLVYLQVREGEGEGEGGGREGRERGKE